MSISRRNLIKAFAASGAALSVPRPAQSALQGLDHASIANATLPPLLVLVHPQAQHAGFLSAVHIATQQAHASAPPRPISADLGLAYINELQQLLTGREPIRMVGVVDDAMAPIVLGLARDTNAQMPWLAQHQADLKQVRHTLLSATDIGFQSTPTSPSQLPTRAISTDMQTWCAQLGYALASSLITPSANDATQAHAHTQWPQHSCSGSFVSFTLVTPGVRHG